MSFNGVLEEHFSQSLKSLNANGIAYLGIGGFAIILHGYVRATKDLDIWIEPDDGHAVGLSRALCTIGISLPVVEAHALSTRDRRVAPGC
jgi:hypothetical protein